MTLYQKKIVLGISGSIAAYKAPMIVRELIKRGAEVRVVMTPSAEKFVSKTVLMNLSKYPVAIEMFEDDIQSGGSWHIHLAHWCDAMLIAPCSATTLARLATGFYDTALSIVACAVPKHIPLIIAPAMDSDMWMHPAVLRNVQKIEEDGAIIIPPEVGELASGIIGQGRLPEIELLLEYVEHALSISNSHAYSPDISQSGNNKPISIVSKDHIADTLLDTDIHLDSEQKIQPQILYGKNILITAGPTIEKIDDVRFISNFSSGKMGYALAEQAAAMGALVTLISGPVHLSKPKGSIKRIFVESAQQMYDKTVACFHQMDIAILCAAVADYTPKQHIAGKLKKGELGENMVIELIKTPDILSAIGKSKTSQQYVVGFALESENEIQYGKEKLDKKNADMIIVNSVQAPDSGFQGDNNTITILAKDGREISYPAMTKHDCANAILYSIGAMINL